jgi:hypothetical protein
MAQKKMQKPAVNVSPIGRAVAAADAAGSREPLFPNPGTYRVKFLGLQQQQEVQGRNPWLKATFDHEGEELAALFCVSTKSLASAAPRLKSLAMALTGCDDVDAYNEFDPHGEFVDALLGFDNRFSEQVEQYVGVEILTKVSRGGDTQDGDWYRNHTFEMIAGEAEETAAE